LSSVDSSFSERLLAWFERHGRHDLPWQHPATPYRVWVSEVMLQQTQVVSVIPYFERFMLSFATVQDLANATVDEVLAHWSGLGYYARGRNLHKAAQVIMQQHSGIFPSSVEDLIALPGIGLSTAHAILSLAYQQPTAICDGNVRRVLARWSALDLPIEEKAAQNRLWQLAQSLQSYVAAGAYTQAIMDLGATLCTRTRPNCVVCPVAADCQARLSGQLVTQWPMRKKKPEKPVRECVMFILVRAGSVWLDAPTQQDGLWGGLYQLPQSLPDVLTVRFPDSYHVVLPKVKHVFTHFSLWITPCVINVTNVDLTEFMTNGVWYNREKDDCSIARPAVVDKLIRYALEDLTHKGALL
jgi:A/G-specific adenine glycosylase